MSIWIRACAVATLCCASRDPSSHLSGPRGGPSHMVCLMQVYLVYQASASGRRQRRLRSPEPHHAHRACAVSTHEVVRGLPRGHLQGSKGMGQLHGTCASGAQSGGMEGMPMGGRGTIPGTVWGKPGEAKCNAHDGLVDLKPQGARDAHDQPRCCNAEPRHVPYAMPTPALRWRIRRPLCHGPVQQTQSCQLHGWKTLAKQEVCLPMQQQHLAFLGCLPDVQDLAQQC